MLTLPSAEEETREDGTVERPIALRGERASLAVAQFMEGAADLVTGGTAGDLPIARAADPPGASLRFDPVAGLFGLVVQRNAGPLADRSVRRALAMAIDRDSIVAALAVPTMAQRGTLLPPGLEEVPQPAPVDWMALPLPERRLRAAVVLRDARAGEAAAPGPLRIRVAMPEGLGYRLIFAFLRRDWRAIGVEAERVAPDSDADLRFVDAVAPATMAAWYLRQFTCDRSAVCDPAADEALAAARQATTVSDRRNLLTKADLLLTDLAVFVPIASPVRWSLVSPRLTGFQPNFLARHPPGELIANIR
jgi:peptide/nickel transport system substrate-binding protein